jgi:hypothetical protein
MEYALLMIIKRLAGELALAQAVIEEQADQLAAVDGLLADMGGELDGLEAEFDAIEVEIKQGY